MRIRLVHTLQLLALATGCDWVPAGPGREISVTVQSAGTGSGRVTGEVPNGDLDCQVVRGSMLGTSCRRTFTDAGGGGRLELTATPDNGSAFQSWSGCTAVNGPICVLTFEVGGPSQPFNVTANFRLNTGADVFGVNMLQNPGFESFIYVGGLPASTGYWIGDSVALARSPVITPHGGSAALRFLATGATGASAAGVSGQQWQIVDISSLASAIDSANVVATAQAWVYRFDGGEATDDRFDVRLTSYRGLPAEFPASYVSPGGVRFHDDVATVIVGAGVWTRASVDVLIPPGVRYLVVEISAHENHYNDASSPEFAGHFVDDASLVLRRLP